MLKITQVCVVLAALLSLALAKVNAVSDRCTEAPEETVHACAACAAALQISMDACCTSDQVLEFCQNLPRLVDDDVMETNAPAKRAGSSWTAETEEDAAAFKRNNMYLLGKRPRNNFLGKRSDAMATQEDMLEDMEKRRRPFLGKRAPRPFLGKRDDFEDMEKRRRPFLGKRDDAFEDLATSEEKRSRRPFLGKRGSRLFLGKRSDQEEPLSEMIKRAKYFLGKKAKYFLGKRSDGLVDSDDQAGDVAAKRQAKYFLGK